MFFKGNFSHYPLVFQLLLEENYRPGIWFYLSLLTWAICELFYSKYHKKEMLKEEMNVTACTHSRHVHNISLWRISHDLSLLHQAPQEQS